MKKNWEYKKFKDICKLVRGPFGGSLKKSYFVQNGFAVYEQSHAIYDQFTKVRYFIDEKKFNEMKRFEVKPRDLIMSCSGTLGKVAIVPENVKNGIINQALLKITPGNSVNNNYLKYWMESPDFQIKNIEYSSGAAIKNVASVKILSNIIVPLPSLPEQQRIVEILDQSFAAIDQAIANTEKNLQNTKDLFQSKLHSFFTQSRADWTEKQLGQITKLNGRIGWRGLTAKEYTKKGPLFLSVHSLNYGDYVDFRDAFHISEERYVESPEIMLQKDDVLICKDGAGIGKCGIVGNLPSNATINSSLLLIRCGKFINSKFLYYCLISPYFQQIVNSRLNGATTPHLYQRDITEFPIYLPSLSEQLNIVEVLDSLNNHIHKLESIYQQKLHLLIELKQSILQKVFTGELT